MAGLGLAAIVIVVALAGLPAAPGPSSTATAASDTAGGTSRGPGSSGGATPDLRPGEPSGGPPGAGAGIPAFRHIFVIVMENKAAASIIGNPNAPFINDLARRYGLATDYLAVAHPSQPNYLALWSGSTQGVRDDRVHDFTGGTTLADQVEASGRSWHVAAENVPLGCYTGATASDGPDGRGTYARKHEPAISWTSVSRDPIRCANITDLRHFDPTLGNLWLIVPNLCHDMHDCSVRTGDAFLAAWLPIILDSRAFADGVVFLTWDEGRTNEGGGGVVATLVISPLARGSFSSATPHSHYSLLRTIEEAWSLPCLSDACRANDLAEFFR